MDKKKSDGPAEYKVGNTLYRVTPVFKDAPQKESVADKIQRLILQDKKQKGAKL